MSDIPSGLKPQVSAPRVNVPNVTGPSITKPTISASGISAPSMSRPTMSRPTISRPTITRPAIPRFNFFIPRIGPAFFTLSVLIFLVLSFGGWWLAGVQRWQDLSTSDDLLMLYTLYGPSATFLGLLFGLFGFMIFRSIKRRMSERAERKKEESEALLAEGEQERFSAEEELWLTYQQKTTYLVSAAVCCGVDSDPFYYESDVSDLGKTFLESNSAYEMDAEMVDLLDEPPLSVWVDLPPLNEDQAFIDVLPEESTALTAREQKILQLLLIAAEKQIDNFHEHQLPFEKVVWKLVVQLPELLPERCQILLDCVKQFVVGQGVAEEKLSISWELASIEGFMQRVRRTIDLEVSDNMPFVWILSADSWHDYDYIEEQSLLVELPLALGEASTSLVFAPDNILKFLRIEPWVKVCRPSTTSQEQEGSDANSEQQELAINTDSEPKSQRAISDVMRESVESSQMSIKDISHIVSSLPFADERLFDITKAMQDLEMTIDPVKDHVLADAMLGDIGACKHSFNFALSAVLASQDEEKSILYVDASGQHAAVIKASDWVLPETVFEDDPNLPKWANRIKPTDVKKDIEEYEEDLVSAS